MKTGFARKGAGLRYVARVLRLPPDHLAELPEARAELSRLADRAFRLGDRLPPIPRSEVPAEHAATTTALALWSADTPASDRPFVQAALADLLLELGYGHPDATTEEPLPLFAELRRLRVPARGADPRAVVFASRDNASPLYRLQFNLRGLPAYRFVYGGEVIPHERG